MRDGERRQFVRREGGHVLALLTDRYLAADDAAGVGDEDDALALGRSAKQPVDARLQARLLLHLARRGGLQHLAGVDEAGREGPAAALGLVGAVTEDDASVQLDDDPDSNLRVLELDLSAAWADRARLAEDKALLEVSGAVRAEVWHGITVTSNKSCVRRGTCIPKAALQVDDFDGFAAHATPTA